VVPDTGVTREFWFDIQNGTAALDGVERIVLTVNGTFPGPTIIADWGDTVGEFAERFILASYADLYSRSCNKQYAEQRHRYSLSRSPSELYKPDGM